MNDGLITFIEGRMPLPGVAAWSVRNPDGELAHCCFREGLSSEQIEQTLARLTLAAESLRYHKIEPARICWVFADLRLHVALRHDGGCLTLFVKDRSQYGDGALLSVLDDFLHVPM